MNVQFGKGKTEYGTGVQIDLTGDEVATAISAYLVAHGIHVVGAKTITVNGEFCPNFVHEISICTLKNNLTENGICNYSSFVNCLIFSNFAEREKAN